MAESCANQDQGDEHAPITTSHCAKDKSIGIGGGAGTAISALKSDNFNGAELIVGNTARPALEAAKADLRIQLGDKTLGGIGARFDPALGRKAAEESSEEIRHALKGSDMAIILTCRGRGTGTGAAPVVARAAGVLGAFTVGGSHPAFRV